MRIPLKGINSVRKRLADGSAKTFYYAWKSGPPLRGEPGSREFIASYNEAVARKVGSPSGVLLSLLQQFQASQDFTDLADSTRRSYIALIKRIEKKFSDFPLSALKDRRARGIFKDWRDAIAVSSGRRQADYSWSVLARVLSWGVDRGIIAGNPCERGGRLYRASRKEKIWTDDDEASFLKHAPAHLHLALLTGAVDRAAARRPSPAAVVGLRRKPYPTASVENGRPGIHSCWSSTEGGARWCRKDEARPDHSRVHRQTILDIRWFPLLMGQSVPEGRHRWSHVQ